MFKVSKFFLITALFLMNLGLFAQNKPSNPKVAVVLSGGGAKGLAHIGVLQALEKAGIYPDIVTGTSMGGIVGGLYALGYSADDIEKLTSDLNWSELLGNQIPFEDVAFEEKEFYGRYIAELPIVGLSPQLPRGLIEGQNLNNFLSDLTRSAHGINSFDELPIPFRCVTTDIATGTRVVLKDGSLAEALRATMAIPSIFTPVEINDILMVDGGLVRNFPVQEALDMGADIVIGIFVSNDLEDKEGLNTMFDILMQSAWVMGAYDTREQRKLVNLYIEPDLEGYSTGDFNSAPAIIKKGQEKGDELLPLLKQLADSLKRTGKVFHKPQKLPQRDVYSFAQVKVSGNEKVPDEFIEGKLRISLNDSVSVKEIDSRIRATYGSRYFSKINYEITPQESTFNLAIKVDERVRKYLKTSLFYNTEIGVGLNVNLTLRNYFTKNSRTLMEFDLADNSRINANFFKYLGVKQNLGLSFDYRYLNHEIPLFVDAQEIATFKNARNNVRIMFQTTSSSTISSGLKIEAAFNSLKPKVIGQGPQIEKGKEESMSTTVFWQKNTMNKPFFATNGTSINAAFGYHFLNDLLLTYVPGTPEGTETQLNSDPYFLTNFELEHIFPVSKRFRIPIKTQLRYASKETQGLNDQVGVGGFFKNYESTIDFWGAEFYEFQLHSFVLAQVSFQYDLTRNLLLIARANYINSKYPIAWWDTTYTSENISSEGDDDIFGFGFGFVFKSILGPMQFTVGKADYNSAIQTGISLGYWH